MTVPTIIFLPLILWPICWMVVRLAQIDSQRPSALDRMLERLSEPTWRVDRVPDEDEDES